jgi:hypothetical protein
MEAEGTSEGRVTAQAVSRRPLTAETRIRARVSLCEVCGGQSGTGTGCSLSFSVFPCQYHTTVDIHSHIIWGVYSRPGRSRNSETYSHPIDMNKNNYLPKYVGYLSTLVEP